MNPRQQGQFVHKVFEVFFSTLACAGHGAITPQTLDDAREVFTAVVEATARHIARGRGRARADAAARLVRRRRTWRSRDAHGGRASGPRGRAAARAPARWRRDDSRRRRVRASIALRGKADRIDLLEDGTFRLVDYKLGWPPQRARALQLPIYAIAARAAAARTTGTDLDARRGGLPRVQGTEARRRRSSASRPIATRCWAMRSSASPTRWMPSQRGEFPPRPDDVFLCEHCSFATVCRKDYVDG